MSKSFEIFISEVNNCILPPDEELKLIEIYQNRQEGWEEAQEKVIKSNLMFVVQTAFQFSTDKCKLQDLISEGSLSLLDSLNKFDRTKGCKFLTFAGLDVRGRMVRYLFKNNSFATLKISTKNIEFAKKTKDFIEEYSQQNNAKPSVKEIAEHLQIKESKALLIIEIAEGKIFSIQSNPDPSDDTKQVEVADESVNLPSFEVNAKEVSSILTKIITDLPIRQQLVINKRFGLNGECPTDLATIGEQLNLTKERVRQIEQSVLRLLRKEIEKVTTKNEIL